MASSAQFDYSSFGTLWNSVRRYCDSLPTDVCLTENQGWMDNGDLKIALCDSSAQISGSTYSAYEKIWETTSKACDQIKWAWDKTGEDYGIPGQVGLAVAILLVSSAIADRVRTAYNKTANWVRPSPSYAQYGALHPVYHPPIGHQHPLCTPCSYPAAPQMVYPGGMVYPATTA